MMAQMLSLPAIPAAPLTRSALPPAGRCPDDGEEEERGGKGDRGKHRAGIPHRRGRRPFHAEAAVQIK